MTKLLELQCQLRTAGQRQPRVDADGAAALADEVLLATGARAATRFRKPPRQQPHGRGRVMTEIFGGFFSVVVAARGTPHRDKGAAVTQQPMQAAESRGR